MTKISLVKSGTLFFLFFHWLAGPRSHLSGTDYLLATLAFQEFKTSNSTRNFKADNRVIRKCLGHPSTFSDLHYEPWIFNFGFAHVSKYLPTSSRKYLAGFYLRCIRHSQEHRLCLEVILLR